ncbi:hypothetical protein IC762_03635 [Bradyrhizobium genosp. L]|nr:hypothetical protein [Bradyrhizobium genosp. L]QPF85435.1 hypothetical protein IC762_03635 [Bradyrhizobium genosp. L]
MAELDVVTLVMTRDIQTIETSGALPEQARDEETPVRRDAASQAAAGF